jgi:hypothetical protein
LLEARPGRAPEQHLVELADESAAVLVEENCHE